MSYLDTPRVHFTGFFQADVSTINNNVRYYNISTFEEQYQHILPSSEGNWNPEGTGIFRLVGCQITGARLGGQQITSAAQDPVIGMALENADQRVSGKLVDLDPQQQMVSQIWGMQVRLTNGVEKALFLGDFLPVGFTNLWLRQQQGLPSDQMLAAVYQSVLHNVVWQGQAHSRVLNALQRATTDGWLSINMNLYGYGRDPAMPRYTLGRVAGTIGPYRAGEPKHFVLGRQMVAAAPVKSPFVPDNGVAYCFQCTVHEDSKTVSADFGNCLQIVNADGAFVDHGILTMAVLKTETDTPLTTVTADQVACLGNVDYQQADWYAHTAGIQEFDYASDPWLVANIGNHPLLLLSPQPNQSYTVLVQESLGGLYVRADNFVCRLNPGERGAIDLFASQWGKPLSASIATSVNMGMMGNAGGAPHQPNPPIKVPQVGMPSEAIRYPEQITTDASGKAVLEIQASSQGPGNPRGYVDGQLYGVGYRLAQQPPQTVSNFWNFISVLAFDLIEVPDQPTWYGDIQPIFQQYSNLYPIMSRHLVRLDDYDSVVAHLNILRLAFALPIDDPNHMPVTRDLSDRKRAMILHWLTTPGPDGLPLKGDPTRAPLRAAAPAHVADDPIPLPLEPIQTGGKTAILLQYEARQRAQEEEPS